MKKGKSEAKKQGRKATVSNIREGWVLTKQELRLMEVLTDPASRLLPVLEICRIAKIGKDTYYRAFDKPDFCKFYRDSIGNLLKRAAVPLVNALLREALRGSAPHLKIALELCGVYDPKGESVAVNVDVIQKISEAEFVEWLRSAQGMTPAAVNKALPAPTVKNPSNPFDE